MTAGPEYSPLKQLPSLYEIYQLEMLFLFIFLQNNNQRSFPANWPREVKLNYNTPNRTTIFNSLSNSPFSTVKKRNGAMLFSFFRLVVIIDEIFWTYWPQKDNHTES